MGNYQRLFEYYKQLGDQAFTQVSDETSFFWSPGVESNSIAVIVQHLHGNMMSRWTDFLTSDGEKTWRNRDQKFELYIDNRKELLELWKEGWSCLFHALSKIEPKHYDQLIYIRNKGHSIDEAIQRQLAHYAYHIGQIVYLARMISSSEWTSLSIPKGASEIYNKKSFEQAKRKEHFTEEFKNKPENKS